MDPTESHQDHPFSHLNTDPSLFDQHEITEDVLNSFEIPSLSNTTEPKSYTLSKTIDKWTKEEHERFLGKLKIKN
jgi:hypothetical protein